jgi:hypothetical protein
LVKGSGVNIRCIDIAAARRLARQYQGQLDSTAAPCPPHMPRSWISSGGIQVT